jgi:hypothetical protein
MQRRRGHLPEDRRVVWRYTPVRVSLGRRLLLAGEPRESGIIRDAEHNGRRLALTAHPARAMRRVAAGIVLPFALVALLALLVCAACATTPVPSTDTRACRTSTDCVAGNVCLFSTYSSCQTLGSCIATPDGQACVPQTACDCSGNTVTVCLVGGNSPSRVRALGSCDGATQQGYDASVPAEVDSGVSTGGAADAADGFVPPVTSDDSGPPVQDSSPGVDAADAATGYGLPCDLNHGNADCTDPVYDQCGINGTCTKTCTRSTQCPVPPTAGSCDLTFDLCN